MRKLFFTVIFVLLCAQLICAQTTVTLTINSDYDTPIPAVGDHLYTSGEQVDASVTLIITPIAPGTQAECKGYSGTGDAEISGGGTGTSVSFNIDTTSTLTWLWETQNYLSTSVSPGAGGSVMLSDGITPAEDWYTTGTLVNIKAIAAPGYAFMSWSGDIFSGSMNESIIIDEPKTITANFIPLPVNLHVHSDYDTPIPANGDHIYSYGDSVTATLSNMTVSSGTLRQIFTGWTGEGSVPASGKDMTTTFIIDEDSTITWNWKLQYYVGVTVSPLAGGHFSGDVGWNDVGVNAFLEAAPSIGYKFDGWDFDGDTVIDSTSYILSISNHVTQNITAYFSPLAEYTFTVSSAFNTSMYPAVGTYNYYEGDMVSAEIYDTVNDIDAVTRYVVSGYTGEGSTPASGTAKSVSFTIDEDSTITWNWKLQYLLKATTSPSEGGTTDLASPDFFDADSTTTVNAEATPGYTFAGWDIDGDTSIDSTNKTIEIFMDSPKEIVAYFDANPLKILHIISEYGNPIPAAGDHVYLQGQSVTASSGNPVPVGAGSRIVANDFSGEGDSEVSSGGNHNTVTFTIDEDTTITWNWKTQYDVNVSSEPSGAGTFDGETSLDLWLYIDQEAIIHASENPGFFFNGWDLDNDSIIDSTENPITIKADSPKTIKGIFEAGRSLIIESAHGTPNPSVATHYYRNGSIIAASVNSPIDGGPGTKFACVGYSGEGDSEITFGGSTPSVLFVLDTDSKIIWNWETYYQLTTIVQPDTAGTIEPSNGYYPEGSDVDLSVSANEGWTFSGWDIDDDGFVDVKNADIEITMYSPAIVKAIFEAVAPTVTLTIESEHGSPDPGAGTHIYTKDTTVTASVETPAEGNDGVRYECIGYVASLNGEPLISGASNSLTFVIEEDTTITWQWATQYRLTTGTDPAVGGEVEPSGETWYDAGETASAECIPYYGYVFQGWDLTGDGLVDFTDNPLNITMDSPMLCTAILSTPSNIVQVYDFEDGTDGWKPNAPVPGFFSPNYSSTGGSLGLNPNGSSLSFGYWGRNEINIEPEQAYKAVYNISSDNFNHNTVPQIRLRSNLTSMSKAWYSNIESFSNASPSTVAKNYELIFDPNNSGPGSIVLSLDLISVSPYDNTNTWVYLNGLSLEKVNITSVSSIASYAFSAEDPQGWAFSGAIPDFDTVTSGTPAAGLLLNPSGSNKAFGFWLSPGIAIEEGKYYRATYNIASDETNRDDVPQFRVRANDPYSWMGWFTTVVSTNNQAPLSTPEPYSAILNPMVGGGSRNINMAFDILSFSSGDNTNTNLIMSSAALEEVNIEADIESPPEPTK